MIPLSYVESLCHYYYEEITPFKKPSKALTNISECIISNRNINHAISLKVKPASLKLFY